jgi:hypothetical protein
MQALLMVDQTCYGGGEFGRATMDMFLILMAAASQAAQAPPPAEQPGAEAPEIKVTCRTQRVTGTRVIKKVCRSVEQQRQDNLEARNKLRMGTQVQATEVFKRPSGE